MDNQLMVLLRTSTFDRFTGAPGTAEERLGGAGREGKGFRGVPAPKDTGDRLRRALASSAMAASFAAIGVGVCGLIGWLFDVPLLRSVVLGEVPMAPGTSACFVALGCSSLLLGRAGATRSRMRALVGRVLALLTALVGTVNLLGQALRIADGRWDAWLIPAASEPWRTLRRMDPIAALDMALIGIGLLLLDWTFEVRGRRYWPTHALVFCSGMAAIVGLLDFVLGSTPSYTHVALPTAVGLFALSFAVVAARPQYGLGALLVSETVGGYVTRRLWPAAVIVPMLIGMLSWRSHSAGMFSEWTALAIMIVSMIALLGGLVVWNGHRIDRSDRSRLSAETALHWRERELEEAHRLARVGNWLWTPSTNQVTWSSELYRIVGINPDEPPPTLRGHANLFVPESAARLRAAFESALQSGTTFELDLTLAPRENSARDVIARGEVEKDDAGAIQLMRGTVQDVTDRKLEQSELARVHRAQKALSRCNQALIRAADEASLLEQVCEIIVATAGYRFCWVGRAGADEQKPIRAVAHAGEDAGYLKVLDLSWGDGEQGQPLLAQCIRLRRILVGGLTGNAPETAKLDSRALERGFSSGLAIPILVGDSAFGALEILASEPRAFGSSEIELLRELADDIAFGIATLETKAAHTRAEEEVRALNADLETRVIIRTSELSALSDAKDALLLQQQATSTELALSHEREADIGFKIQQTLLLDAPPCDVPGLHVAARTLPSQRVDGDFYAFISPNDQVLDVIVGDVMGKGVIAALLGAATKSHLSRAVSDLACACDRRSLPRPQDIVMLAHAGIARHLIELGSFVTLCYARLHLLERRFEFVDCGHTGILLLDACTGCTRLIHGENLPLGVREGEVYRQLSVSLAPGDTMLLFSDGITDARSATGEVFGLERLEQCVQKHAALNPGELIEAVNGAVSEFSGGRTPSDDQTSVAIRVDAAALPLWHGEAETRSDLGELARVREFVRSFCQNAPGQPLDSAATAELELAVNEAASNIMKHAYAGYRDQPIRIDADAYADRISVRLRHVGSPFEPERAPEPALNGTRESGFGAFIITSSVDEVRYYRDASGRNCVALVKRRK